MVRLENSEIILNEGNWIVSLHYMLWHLEFLVTPKCSTFKLYWPEFSKKKKKYCKNLTDSVSLYLSLSYCYIVRKLQEVSIKQINQETQKGCWLITGFQMFFVSSFHFLFLLVGSFWSLLETFFNCQQTPENVNFFSRFFNRNLLGPPRVIT